MLLRVWFLLLCWAVAGGAAELPRAEREPSPSAPEHGPRMAQAVRAHDQGELERAIALYEEILAENPDDVLALYELTYSQTEKGDYAGCVKTARRGARYRSEVLGRIRMMLASCLDLGGQAKKAAKVYRESIADAPEDFLLRFNHAVTLQSMGEMEAAMDETKAAVTLAPAHASSHLLLAKLYVEMGYQTPAVLATLRFLTLEPRTPRSGEMLQRMHGLLNGRVSENEDGGMTITISMPGVGGEGEFGGSDLILALGQAVRRTAASEGEEDPTPFEMASKAIRMVLSASAEANQDPPKNAFAARYYLPYFLAARENGHLETMVYLAYSASTLEDVAAWIEANGEKLEEFQAWSARYDGWRGVTIEN